MEQLYPQVKTAARSVAREWPGVIDPDDIAQEISLEILKWKGYADRLADMTDQGRSRALRRIGHQIASRERDDYAVFRGNIRYSSRDVRALLEKGLLMSLGDCFLPTYEYDPVNGVKLGTEDYEETLCETTDIQEGLRTLHERNPNYASIIVSQYMEGISRHNHAKDLTRAVDALADAMNKIHKRRWASYYDGPGTKTVVSNSTARRLCD